MSEAKAQPASPRRPVPAWAWPVGLTLAALLLRLVGIAWGLPNTLHHQSYHPDEHLLLFYALPLDIGHGVWDPHFYNYGSLWLYVLSVASRVVDGWGLAGDNWANFHLAGRLISAVMGSITVAFAFIIGKRLSGFWAGLTAGVALALAPGSVMHSRFHTVDIPATFFVTAVLLVAVKSYQEENVRRAMWYATWGFAVAGLAVAVKYNMAVAVLPLLLALWLRPWPTGTRAQLSIFGLAWMALAFVITTPGALFSSAEFLRDLRFEMQHVKEGHGLVFVNTPPAAVYQLGNLVQAVGWGTLLLGLVGIFAAWRDRSRPAWILLAFVVPYYLLIGGPGIEVKFLRYVLPVCPVLCVFAGYALAKGVRTTLVESRWAVVAGAVLLVSFATAANFLVVTEQMVRKDPRDEAAEVLAKEAMGKSIGLVTVPFFYTPPFFPDTGALVDPVSRLSGAEARLAIMERQAPSLRYYRPGQGGTPEWEPGLIEEIGPDYVV